MNENELVANKQDVVAVQVHYKHCLINIHNWLLFNALFH